ncbi:hypothetical protein ACEZCY_32960 [Streptacidiphilus sp. N1-12]|uniref:Uncharacterized protein n=2 Tax=Streptacidiphilus alkalitolerans TaxID=3342712 RepID=A0ABV6VJS4_9ACTN
MTDATSPAAMLSAARVATLRTRQARRGFWFPLVLFGLIVLGATPFYRQTVPSGSGCAAAPPGTLCFETGHPGPLGAQAGLGSTAATVYWLTAVVLGYAATLAFYRWRGTRTGVAGRALPYVLAGVAFLGLAVLASPAVWAGVGPLHGGLPGDLTTRGLLPLLVLALGLLVLAYSERSAALAGFAALFLAVALVSNLYDVENRTPSIGWTPSEAWSLLPNLWLAGLTLMLGGLGFGLAAALRGRGGRNR